MNCLAEDGLSHQCGRSPIIIPGGHPVSQKMRNSQDDPIGIRGTSRNINGLTVVIVKITRERTIRWFSIVRRRGSQRDVVMYIPADGIYSAIAGTCTKQEHI